MNAAQKAQIAADRAARDAERKRIEVERKEEQKAHMQETSRVEDFNPYGFVGSGGWGYVGLWLKVSKSDHNIEDRVIVKDSYLAKEIHQDPDKWVENVKYPGCMMPWEAWVMDAVKDNEGADKIVRTHCTDAGMLS